MKINISTVISASLLAVVPVQANLVLNGTFESLASAGVASDWTVNPKVTDTLGYGVGASYGEVFSPSSSKITQGVVLGGSGTGHPPVTYQVTFYA